MDMPGSRQPARKKRDPEKNKQQQKLYRQRLYASVNGIEDVKAVHRRRYHERMARMRANGEYEAFKAKKTQEGMRRYHAMSEEQRAEVKRKNAQCQRNWMQKMKDQEELEHPFPLPWLPLDWAESEPEPVEEDRVQTVRTEALQQLDHYL